MYLARRFIDSHLQYVLCESYDNGTCLTNRDLVLLGSRPERFIKYAGGSSFYIDDSLFECLQQQGITALYEEVEQFFLPFLDPYIRNKISRFCDRSQYRNWKPMSAKDKARVLDETHVFDRRRMHYLRLGQVDQSSLDKPVALYKKLLDKSRDELEQFMIAREQTLAPSEYKRYVFAIFNLQRFFSESCARIMPQVLQEDKLDTFFVQEVCHLDSDRSFWQGLERSGCLSPYLIRYVVMYFDYNFPGSRSWNNFIHSFSGQRQSARRHVRSQRMSINKASTIFGVSRAELAAMDRKKLTGLYRKKAFKLHPDKGGDHDRFIELTAAYNELLRTHR
ncbi:MAG TPA: J domain-containing protein [Desulfobulbaceae bacterium]|nr:J domain-containing protein [Desulfobulbaceae bacterium]